MEVIYQRDIRLKYKKVESFIINEKNNYYQRRNNDTVQFSKFSFLFLKHVFKETFLPVGINQYLYIYINIYLIVDLI